MDAGFIIILVLILAVGNDTVCEGAGSGGHPAFFVFGDSLVDIGNNNYLATSARADSPPYGVDYPTHCPTGRFSNGLNIPDLISKISNVFSICLTLIIFIYVNVNTLVYSVIF